MATPARKESSVELVTVQVERLRDQLAAVQSIDEARDYLDRAVAMQLYLRRQAASLQLQADAVEVQQYAMRRLGELVAALEGAQGRRDRAAEPLPAGGKKSKREQLAELGVATSTAHRWEKLAEMPEEEFRARLDLQRAKITKAEAAGVGATSAHSEYDGDEAYTPKKYTDAAREVFGEDIALDPASCAYANKHLVHAKRFLSKQQNGLGAAWMAPTLWLNSPYSFPLVHEFQNKFIGHFEAKYFRQGITLVNNNTDTKWAQWLLERYPACFHAGRISFVNARGEVMNQNRQGQIFFYAGPRVATFKKVFGEFGKVVVPA